MVLGNIPSLHWGYSSELRFYELFWTTYQDPKLDLWTKSYAVLIKYWFLGTTRLTKRLLSSKILLKHTSIKTKLVYWLYRLINNIPKAKKNERIELVEENEKSAPIGKVGPPFRHYQSSFVNNLWRGSFVNTKITLLLLSWERLLFMRLAFRLS